MYYLHFPQAICLFQFTQVFPPPPSIHAFHPLNIIYTWEPFLVRSNGKGQIASAQKMEMVQREEIRINRGLGKWQR
jgi:hypothetical protein